MQSYSREYGPKEIVFREGDPSADLLYLESGRILICTLNGTEVKALAYISAGEFIGELSFFDSKPRSTHIITTEKSKIIQIPKHELSGKLPFWFLEVGKALTQKIRKLDHVVQETKIRKSGTQMFTNLTIEEQRTYYELLTK